MEIWKKIKNYEVYEVSNQGKIRSTNWHRMGITQEIKPRMRKGYLAVSLPKDTFSVHILVAKAFIPYTGLNPDGTPIKGNPQVNHKDENTMNNSVENLEWCDAKYNNNYGTKLKRQGEKLSTVLKGKHLSPNTEFKGKKVKLIDTLTKTEKEYNSIKDLAEENNWKYGSVSSAVWKGNLFLERYVIKYV